MVICGGRAIFFLSGFWHGAGLSFIVWGCMHGAFSVITRKFKVAIDKIHPAFNWIITFIFINFSWVFFRASSCKQALKVIYRVIKLQYKEIPIDIIKCFKIPEFRILISKTPILNYFPNLEILLFFSFAHSKMNEFKPSIARCFALVILLLSCLCRFSNVSSFLYFGF